MEYTRYINSITRDSINLVVVGECEEVCEECKEKVKGEKTKDGDKKRNRRKDK